MKKITVVLSALCLSACGFLPSVPFVGGSDKPEETYVDLRAQPPLQVPADMQAIDLEQVVPDLTPAPCKTLLTIRTSRRCPMRFIRQITGTRCGCSVWATVTGW